MLFKSYSDYLCEKYLPIADRLEKTKRKIIDNWFFFQNGFVLNILNFFLTFPSTPPIVLFAHRIAFSLPLNRYSSRISSPYAAPRLILFLLSHILCCDLEEKEISWTLTNSRMEPAHVKEALSLLDRVHLFGIQNEGDWSFQYAVKGIINMIDGIIIRSMKLTLILSFFHCLVFFYNMFMLYSTGVQELKMFLF